MVEQPIEVDVQIAGRDVPAGRLWTHRRGQSKSATFSYREDYLQRADAYELDPGLPPPAGQQQTPVKQPLFGAMSDCAPDGWGRRLVRRAEAQRAREADTQQRGLTEVDFLLGARDDLRQGALRFRGHDSEQYLALDTEGVPHLIGLPRLLGAAEKLERDEPTSEDLRLLLHGGSSLGGARPKAHVLDTEGRLAIALEVAPLFRLPEMQARAIVAEVLAATERWRDVARATGLGAQQLERLEPAFEHEQSAAARELIAAPS